jgi:ankyrin repeat protein
MGTGKIALIVASSLGVLFILWSIQESFLKYPLISTIEEQFDIAVTNNDLEIIKKCLKKRASLARSIDKRYGETPLHLIARHPVKDYLTVAQLFIDSGADVNAQSKEGFTPLYWANLSGDSEMVKLLLTNGADANQKLPNGETLISMAADRDYADVVEL